MKCVTCLEDWGITWANVATYWGLCVTEGGMCVFHQFTISYDVSKCFWEISAIRWNEFNTRIIGSSIILIHFWRRTIVMKLVLEVQSHKSQVIVQTFLLSFSGNYVCLDAISMCGHGGSDFFYSPNLTELHNVFPKVCVVCWLSLQFVCCCIGAGDTARWGTVTPTDRHSRESRAWECPQSKPQTPITDVIYGTATRHCLKL